MPDKVTRSVLGRLGAPPMPLDPAVEDRIKGANRAKELEEEPRMVSLEDLRAKVGRDYSDEEFPLRAVMPAGQVDAMVAAGPAAPTHDPAAPEGQISAGRTDPAQRAQPCENRQTRLCAGPERRCLMHSHPIRAAVFDIDGTLAMIDKDNGTYQALPGAAQALADLGAPGPGGGGLYQRHLLSARPLLPAAGLHLAPAISCPRRP